MNNDQMETLEGNSSVYSTNLYDFEKNFNHDAFLDWITRHWTYTWWYATIYVSLVMAAKRYMLRRLRFELRWALVVWSGFLAVFSIAGAVRTIPELMYVMKHHGYSYSVCNPSYFYGPTAFWAFMFVISKVYELGDTIFIVLRKQPLIFLHWYHHVTVMIYVWYSYTDHTAPGRWFMVMNYTVHSFMYTYYTFRALQFRLPKFVSMFVTSVQISQMAVGLVINVSSYVIKSQGLFCQQSNENRKYCLVMYCSYFILFIHFFFSSYVQKKKIDDILTSKSTKDVGILGDGYLATNGKKLL